MNLADLADLAKFAKLNLADLAKSDKSHLPDLILKKKKHTHTHTLSLWKILENQKRFRQQIFVIITQNTALTQETFQFALVKLTKQRIIARDNCHWVRSRQLIRSFEKKNICAKKMKKKQNSVKYKNMKN